MLRLHKITLGYGEVKVLKQVTLTLSTGEIGCILGPSGCGKTTLLQSIAGFHKQLHGEIHLDDICIASEQQNKRPDQREVGMVFQDFALFPHMTVLENVSYGLHRLSESARKDAAKDIIEKVGMSEYEHAFPHQLSGGQQQRVAIARAVAPKPRLLLLDEPFSSLDPALREKVAVELRDIIKRLGISALLVTHDQQEAFAFADKIGIFAEGHCQQWASPYELYHKPNSAFVANFIGESTFIEGKVVKQPHQTAMVISQSSSSNAKNSENASSAKSATLYIQSQLGLHPLESAISNRVGCDYQVDDVVQLLVRPDDIMHKDDSPLKAKVVDRRFRGAHILYRLALPQQDLQDHEEQVLCLAPSHHDHQIGESFGIVLSIDHVICFSS